MDAGIADAINRHDAKLMARCLDASQAAIEALGGPAGDWFSGEWSEAIMADDPAIATYTPGDPLPIAIRHVGGTAHRAQRYYPLRFDGHPADNDWHGFVNAFRAEIEQRRTSGPQIPSSDVRAAGSVQVV